MIDLFSPAGALRALLPEIVLSAWALLVLLVVAWRRRTSADCRLAGWLSAADVCALCREKRFVESVRDG